MDEDAAEGARAAIEVLVGAPEGKVGSVVMQVQAQVARAVRQIEADARSDSVPSARHRLLVECLAGEVIHVSQQHERQGGALPLDGRQQVLGPQCVLPGPRADFHHGGLGGETVEARLGGHGIPVRGKGVRLHQHPEALRGGTVEAHHQQVEVDGEGVHHHHLVRLGAHQARRRRGEQLVVGEPWRRAPDMPLDAERCPSIERLADVAARLPRLEPERISRKVDTRASVRPGRQVEGLAEARQEVRRIQRPREGLRVLEGHTGFRPSHAQALSPNSAVRAFTESSLSERMSAPGGDSPKGNG